MVRTDGPKQPQAYDYIAGNPKVDVTRRKFAEERKPPAYESDQYASYPSRPEPTPDAYSDYPQQSRKYKEWKRKESARPKESLDDLLEEFSKPTDQLEGSLGKEEAPTYQTEARMDQSEPQPQPEFESTIEIKERHYKPPLESIVEQSSELTGTVKVNTNM